MWLVQLLSVHIDNFFFLSSSERHFHICLSSIYSIENKYYHFPCLVTLSIFESEIVLKNQKCFIDSRMLNSEHVYLLKKKQLWYTRENESYQKKTISSEYVYNH